MFVKSKSLKLETISCNISKAEMKTLIQYNYPKMTVAHSCVQSVHEAQTCKWALVAQMMPDTTSFTLEKFNVKNVP